jgi:hypothetical protein
MTRGAQYRGGSLTPGPGTLTRSSDSADPSLFLPQGKRAANGRMEVAHITIAQEGAQVNRVVSESLLLPIAGRDKGWQRGQSDPPSQGAAARREGGWGW